jgi:hypothetical protein
MICSCTVLLRLIDRRLPLPRALRDQQSGSQECDCESKAQFSAADKKMPDRDEPAMRQVASEKQELFRRDCCHPINESRPHACQLSTWQQLRPGSIHQRRFSMSTLLRKLVLGSAVMVFANVGYAQNAPAGSAAAPPLEDRPAQPADVPSSGSSGTSSAAPTEVPVVPVAPIESRASNPATDGSNDPLIQRRKAKYRAKMEYEARMKAAKSEYKEEKHDAKAEYKADKREANAALRAAEQVPADQRNVDGRTNSSSSGR